MEIIKILNKNINMLLDNYLIAREDECKCGKKFIKFELKNPCFCVYPISFEVIKNHEQYKNVSDTIIISLIKMSNKKIYKNTEFFTLFHCKDCNKTFYQGDLHDESLLGFTYNVKCTYKEL